MTVTHPEQRFVRRQGSGQKWCLGDRIGNQLWVDHDFIAKGRAKCLGLRNLELA